jgi:hypothetical protein
MPDTARSLANRIIRFYPRPWRQRYSAEMQAILDEIPVQWRQTIDLAAGAIREWLSPRALGWPARSAAARILSVRAFKFFAVAYAIDGAARLVAWQLNGANVTISSTVSDITEWLFVAGASRFLLAMVLGWKESWRIRFPRLHRLTTVEIALGALVAFVWFTVEHMQPVPAWVRNITIHNLAEATRPWVWSNCAYQASELTLRLKRVQYPHDRRRIKTS